MVHALVPSAPANDPKFIAVNIEVFLISTNQNIRLHLADVC
jgi:hypothetical protein